LPKSHPDFEWQPMAEAPAKDELISPEQMDQFCGKYDGSARRSPGPRKDDDNRVSRHF